MEVKDFRLLFVALGIVAFLYFRRRTMKITIIVDSTKRYLPSVIAAASLSIQNGDDDGTYGIGKIESEYTIARWPKDGIDCLACGGSAFTLPPTKKEEEVAVPLIGKLTKEQVAELNQAIEDKNHASYLCYMMLRRLDSVVSLQELLKLAAKEGLCDEEVLEEFFGDLEETTGCCEVEGHTIPSLLAMWQERTDKMMELVAVR